MRLLSKISRQPNCALKLGYYELCFFLLRSQMVGGGQQQPLVIHCPVQTQPAAAAAAPPQTQPADPNQQQIIQ